MKIVISGIDNSAFLMSAAVELLFYCKLNKYWSSVTKLNIVQQVANQLQPPDCDLLTEFIKITKSDINTIVKEQWDK